MRHHTHMMVMKTVVVLQSTTSLTSVTKQSNEHLKFLNAKDRNLLMLNRHQTVKQLFLRYNTALSSSAPVERLFSSGSLILSKKRNRLSDKLFETLSMLKTNKQFRRTWNGVTYYLHLKNSCLSFSWMLFMWTITVNCQWFLWLIIICCYNTEFWDCWHCVSQTS